MAIKYRLAEYPVWDTCNSADAGKPVRTGIIPANKNANRLVVIAGLIE